MSVIPSDIKITPWLEQFRAFKEEYPDALLLFRMGDFYEMFFDDARQAASTLNIALTARDPEKKIPMAGIPHHALNSYLTRLIRAGYRAAICEQIGEPNPKGLVERRVIRVVTPGTYLPENEESESAHLASVWPLKGRVAMALLSVNTGLLEAGTLSTRDAEAMLSAFSPGEILYPSNIKALPDFMNAYNLRPVTPETFKPENASRRLKSALHTTRLEGFGINDGDICAGPAWAALDYLTATQFSSLNDVLKLAPLMVKDRMSLDSSAQKNLELIPETSGGSVSLFSSIDKCRTNTGRRTLKDWILRPLMDVKSISERQRYIGALVSSPRECSQLQDALSGTRDIERSLSRLALGTGNPLDLGAIRETLRLIPAIRSVELDEPLRTLQESLPDTSELSEYMENALEEKLPRFLGNGAVIRSSFSQELQELRDFSQKGEEWLAEYVERERQNTGTPKLKAGYTKA
ncbi:MAG: hypothetical protein IJG39_10440 [Synergistaceae bacterium]|nr:hypothetical protein [Synergistaceae bacterium]